VRLSRSVHERTVSSSSARNRLEATTDIETLEQLPRSGPSRLIHIDVNAVYRDLGESFRSSSRATAVGCLKLFLHFSFVHRDTMCVSTALNLDSVFI